MLLDLGSVVETHRLCPCTGCVGASESIGAVIGPLLGKLGEFCGGKVSSVDGSSAPVGEAVEATDGGPFGSSGGPLFFVGTREGFAGVDNGSAGSIETAGSFATVGSALLGAGREGDAAFGSAVVGSQVTIRLSKVDARCDQ